MSEDSLNEATRGRMFSKAAKLEIEFKRRYGQLDSSDAAICADIERLEAAIQFVRGHWGHTDLFPPEGDEYCPKCGSGERGYKKCSACFTPIVQEHSFIECIGDWHSETGRHKMQPFRSPGDESAYDGPKYLPDERCLRCKFEQILEAK